MRTNIFIDESLVEKAIALSGLKTKKAVVHAALAEYVAKLERRDLSELRGRVDFADGYDYKAAREGRIL
ncbi:MAG: type II toxin-antitoxin system VapB family antitoxin [Clostridiales bacterium]|nr:type II toxin-antitoxin system VapB family antitoxin [Clostridiales bacterium]